MGWLIVTPSAGANIRCWNANAQDNALRPGEQWIAWATPVEDLDHVRWDGAAVVPYTPPPPPMGRDFLRALVQQLDPAPTRLDRATALMMATATTLAAVNTALAWTNFVGILNIYERLAGGDLAILRKLWPQITALSAGERSRIESLAGQYGITLP